MSFTCSAASTSVLQAGTELSLRSPVIELEPLAAGSAPQLQFREAHSGGANYIGLQAPGLLNGDFTYTLPTSPGSSGLFLTSTAAGVMSWAQDNNTNFAEDDLTLNGNRVHNFNQASMFWNSIGATGETCVQLNSTIEVTSDQLTLRGTDGLSPRVQMFEASGTGTSTITFSVAALATDDAYTFPGQRPQGTSKFLQCTPGGTMSWETPSLGGTNRKENADDFGNVSGSVSVVFDNDNYDHKRYRLVGNTTFNVTASSRDGDFIMLLQADGTRRQILWSAPTTSRSILPTYVEANDTLTIIFINHGGILDVVPIETDRQTIDGSSVPATWIIDCGNVYRKFRVTGSLPAGRTLAAPNNLPWNTIMELEFLSSGPAPTITGMQMYSGVPSHSAGATYTIRSTPDSLIFCAGEPI